MQDFKIEVRFRYEGNIGYHYVFEKKKDEATAFTSAIKVAETYFRSCGWKKVELISVGLLTNPNSPPEIKSYAPPTPVPSSSKPKPKRAVRSSGKASTAKPKRAPSTRRRTKPETKPEPAKRSRTSTRKPKR